MRARTLLTCPRCRSSSQNLGKPLGEAVTAVIEQTFIDKVVSGLGLVVTLYDILGVGDGHIYHSDGGAHYSVKFRVVVFVPFVGETLVGKVSSMDE
jgi:DNA-directed RNA polymerase III subunit RPC8